ncbi:MAG: lipoprotein signal peptidase [Bacteroidota bacterium]|nr:lipoprotein signal peptidase [Bacteroidota bacterium]MDX5431489.1 lipoprotein signal peptidase [Bacteroidota bacterium]MDX5470213.1 lipoprotein signal peptidase [Bacteroidota bacterium]
MNTVGTSFKAGLRTALLVIFAVILMDQVLKIWIKTHMTMDEEIPVIGDWFILHFTENPGMAFGMEFGGTYGKLLLTLFRIIAVGGLSYYLYTQIKAGVRMGFIICLAMITAGAAGNIIDSIFYGVFFSESTHYQLATAFPETGYATWFHGEVVDMFYMPIFKGYLPEALGGDYFIFFRPIFNLADASISLGVFFILLFQKRFFSESSALNENTEATVIDEAVNSSDDLPISEEDDEISSAQKGI